MVYNQLIIVKIFFGIKVEFIGSEHVSNPLEGIETLKSEHINCKTMKTKILLTATLLILVTLGMGSKIAANAAMSDKTVLIRTTPESRSLVESWTKDYTKNNSGINFEIQPLNFSAFSDELTNSNTLGFFVKRPDVSMVGESMWQMVVGRDIIVPVISRENPFAEILNAEGVSVKELSALTKSKEMQNWNSLLQNAQNAPIHFYILNKPEVEVSVSRFLEIDPALIKSVEAKPMDEILEILKNDKYSIAFCRLADAVDWEKHDFIESVSLLPIDKNGNGRLDFNENIFANLESFERAVWIGKYPKSLIYNIYAVSSTQPEDDAITEFLSWVVTSGQQSVGENGYTELASNEVRSNLEKLTPSFTFAPIQAEKGTNTRAIVLGVIVLGLILFFVAVFVNIRGKSGKRISEKIHTEKVLNETVLNIPGGVFFDKSHTWVFIKKDGTVKMGIDDFLQHVTGKFTGVVLKEPGQKIAKNEPVITLIQEGKKINISSPVSGIIREINEELVTSPHLMNSSPYSKGWIYSVEPSNLMREVSFYKMAEPYREWVKKEFARLKDFVATVADRPELAGQLVYQEGGELQDHPLQQLGPKAWEDFQVQFIDTSDMN